MGMGTKVEDARDPGIGILLALPNPTAVLAEEGHVVVGVGAEQLVQWRYSVRNPDAGGLQAGFQVRRIPLQEKLSGLPGLNKKVLLMFMLNLFEKL